MAKANHVIDLPTSPETAIRAIGDAFRIHGIKTKSVENGGEGAASAMIAGKEPVLAIRLVGNPATVTANVLASAPGWSRVHLEATCFGFGANQVHVEEVLLNLDDSLRRGFGLPPLRGGPPMVPVNALPPVAPPVADDPNLPPRLG